MIRFDQVTVRFGTRRALDRVDAAVGEGEGVLVTGPSGCGKTTFARCLNGLVPHAVTTAALDGDVRIAGRSTREQTVAGLSTTVGLVFQNPSTQLFCLTVGEEVEFGPRNLGLAESEVRRRASGALDALDLLPFADRPLATLSAGERQRAAIAAVLAMEPRVLVLDEPTARLDTRSRSRLVATLGELLRRGLTLVIVEHRLGDATRLAPRTLVMSEGKIALDGPTHGVFERRELLRQLGLRRPSSAEESEWTTLLGPAPRAGGVPIVQLSGIEAGYRNRRVLCGLDLAFHEGEFVAVVGDNGSGKTTLARLLAGLVRPDAGTITWRDDHRTPGRDVGLLFQNPLDQLFTATVEEEVRFGPERFGLPDLAAIDRLLDAHDLAALRGRAIGALSSGQQQRTALAAVLALRPRLVILDEPTMGQDWRHLSRFMDYLVALNRQGCTVLLISHDYKLVHRYAGRVLVLDGGRVVADGAPAGPYHPGAGGPTDAVEHA